MARWARFVWGEGELWPGPVSHEDERLLKHPLHIEFRGGERSIPLNQLRQFIPEQQEVQIEAHLRSHKSVMDMLMLGCQRVGLDLFSDDKEIALGHAVTEHIMMTIWLPSETNLTYLTDTLFPRLDEVLSFAPRQILLVSRRQGDLAYVVDHLPSNIRNQFQWWLAPDEGEEVSLRSNQNIAGWIVDGARLIGELR